MTAEIRRLSFEPHEIQQNDHVFTMRKPIGNRTFIAFAEDQEDLIHDNAVTCSVKRYQIPYPEPITTTAKMAVPPPKDQPSHAWTITIGSFSWNGISSEDFNNLPWLT